MGEGESGEGREERGEEERGGGKFLDISKTIIHTGLFTYSLIYPVLLLLEHDSTGR